MEILSHKDLGLKTFDWHDGPFTGFQSIYYLKDEISDDIEFYTAPDTYGYDPEVRIIGEGEQLHELGVSNEELARFFKRPQYFVDEKDEFTELCGGSKGATSILNRFLLTFE